MIDLGSAREQLTQLEARLVRRLGGRPSAEASGDTGDVARANAEQDARGLDGDLVRGRLVAVRAALARIAARTYGDCERCGELVGKKRLEAIPETPVCIGCAEILERQARAAARSSGTPSDEDC